MPSTKIVLKPHVLRQLEACKTQYCHVVSPSLRHPPVRLREYDEADPESLFKCPRCEAGFPERAYVKREWRKCIEFNGNPEGKAYWEHPSYLIGHKGTTVVNIDDNAADGENSSQGYARPAAAVRLLTSRQCQCDFWLG